MVAVELFVAFFEVTFLYREIVMAFIPAFAGQTAGAVVVASMGWLGVRGLTWFLFGQFGTAPLMAFISRRPLAMPSEFPVPVAAGPAWWDAPVQDFKREVDWLHAKSDRMLEYLALPALHVIAAAVNFGMVLVASRPVFHLPFKGLDEIPDSRTILSGLHLQPRKP
jgi:hypothetical protein